MVMFSEVVCRRRPRGLSLVEVLVTVAVVGILGTLTVVGLGNLHHSAGDAKSESDVKTLNRAVSSFIGSDGNFDDCESAEDVLNRLKTVADESSSKRLIGFTGSSVDPQSTHQSRLLHGRRT